MINKNRIHLFLFNKRYFRKIVEYMCDFPILCQCEMILNKHMRIYSTNRFKNGRCMSEIKITKKKYLYDEVFKCVKCSNDRITKMIPKCMRTKKERLRNSHRNNTIINRNKYLKRLKELDNHEITKLRCNLSQSHVCSQLNDPNIDIILKIKYLFEQNCIMFDLMTKNIDNIHKRIDRLNNQTRNSVERNASILPNKFTFS